MEYRHRPPASQTGPDFGASLGPGGYVWWYLDGLSDCGRHGLTVIAMLGCVFSPWYARARRRGTPDPLDHSALNVALYGAGGRRWAMTERDRHAVERAEHELTIGPSRVSWQADTLCIDVREVTAPLPRPLQGTIRVAAPHRVERHHVIDRAGRHRWYPIAPRARIEVEFREPRLRWSGHAYLDANAGDAPLEDDFTGWHWSRAWDTDATRVLYDVAWRGGGGRELAVAFDDRGAQRRSPAPPRAALPATAWRLARETRCDPGAQPRVVATLEDGPFYARSLVETSIGGRRLTGFHESVSLQRFAARWVQSLLPVRLPRRASRRST